MKHPWIHDHPALARPVPDAAAGIEVVEIVHPERFCFGAETRSPASPAQARILILDTLAHLAAITASMLTDLGYEARWCIDSRDVIEHLDRDAACDLLVAPALNPTLDAGLALARAAQARQPALRILLTHGSAQDVGTAPFERLAKPYSQTKLHHKVRQVLVAPPGTP
ncbi:hypothetical protein [Piscinibacter gummiphilus]|uniref:Uncharacterized protein n=1 Tax=Piscinibacter gummiphilus TaxID=946333 RepID=A0A1W6LCZ5_9BURK|nr:hypothetical protein [Piscinibacter gummiphilus]ARN22099.1 hypothetical protein A4W93_20565 [Piscinibacter gummiphilus]ATU66788.1 hypothetical protein CPZ87_20660 [Piscinibacter gummiphilus]GLS94184.1 hypothetical protein GCM10007918_14760 [Piscinibacter gummiphilus]